MAQSRTLKRPGAITRLMLWQFALLHRIARRAGDRLTPLGSLLVVTALAAGAFGIDTRRTLGAEAFALLACLLLLAWLASLRLRLPLAVERRLPETATVGEPLRYRVCLENAGGKVLAGLQLRDLLLEPLPTPEQFRRSGHADHTLNRFDRIIGYPRWLRLLRRNRGADLLPCEPAPLPPGGSSALLLELRPLRRGYLHFRELQIARPDPLGLCLARQRFAAPARLLVLPRRYRVAPPDLPGGRRYQPGGRQLVGGVGDAREFCGLRDYRPGDPLRHIEWRAWARTGQPVVREYQEEYFMRLGLVLDSFLGQRDPELFEEAISVCASYVEALAGGEGLVDLLFVGNEATHLSSGRGTTDHRRLLEVLACAEPCDDAPFEALPALLARYQEQLSACLCVLLDWDPPRREMVRWLRGRGVPLQVLVLHGPDRQPPEPGPMADRPRHFLTLPLGRVGERLERAAGGHR